MRQTPQHVHYCVIVSLPCRTPAAITVHHPPLRPARTASLAGKLVVIDPADRRRVFFFVTAQVSNVFLTHLSKQRLNVSTFNQSWLHAGASLALSNEPPIITSKHYFPREHKRERKPDGNCSPLLISSISRSCDIFYSRSRKRFL